MYYFLVFIFLIAFFSFRYFREEKLNTDYKSEKAEETDNIILELKNIRSVQNRISRFWECKVDLFLTNDRLYINTYPSHIRKTYPPHPLILTREELEKRRKCQLLQIKTDQYGCSLFFTFMGSSIFIPDEIRIYDLTWEQKQLISDVLKISEGKDGLHVYYLEKLSE